MNFQSYYIFVLFTFYLLAPVQANKDVAGLSKAGLQLQVELNPVLSNYFRLRDALANSNPGGAALAAKAMKNALDSSEITIPEKQEEIDEILLDLSQGLEQIANTEDLKIQRMHFEQVSAKFYELLKIVGTAGKTVYRQHCPIALDNKGAFWLTEKRKIRNPYFGKSRLKCGKTVEVLKL